MPNSNDLRLQRISLLEDTYSTLQSDLPLLDERINLLREVSTEAKHRSTLTSFASQLQRNLGVALYTRFQHVRDIRDLDEARECLSEARGRLPLTCTKITSPSPCTTESLLGSVLRERIRELEVDEDGDLEKALEFHRQPFSSACDMSDLEKAYHSRELGLTLRNYWRLVSANAADLQESVTLLRDSRSLSSRAGVNDLHSTFGLSIALCDLCRLGKDERSYLEESISLSREAVRSCDIHSRDIYMARYSAAVPLMNLGIRFDDISALNEAKASLYEVLDDAPLGWSHMLVSVTSNILTTLFRKQGREADISEAVHLLTSQIARMNPEHATWGQMQEILGIALFARFSVTGAPEDIEGSARAMNLALSSQCTGTLLHVRLINLAACRAEQYGAFGDLTHLEQSITLLKKVKQLTAPQSVNFEVVVGNLLETLRIHYEQTGHYDDLDEATQLVESCHLRWNRKSVNTHTYLTAAGNLFLLRFQLSKSLDDLQRATAFHKDAFESCASASEPEYSETLLSYARVLRIRYEALGDDDSATTTTKLLQQVCDTLPDVHPNYARATCDMARLRLSTNSNTSNIIDEALDLILACLDNKYCPVYRRMKDILEVLTYLKAAEHPLDLHSSLKLAEVYSLTIGLLPEVASFGLDSRTRLTIVADAGRLTAYGAAHAISLARLDRALEMLEAGRGIFWSQNLHLRTPFDNLPEPVGSRLTDIARALERPLLESLEVSDRDRELERRRRLGNDFRSTIEEARNLPGFENLLQNPNFNSLTLAARRYPVVVFIPGDNISHVIIVSSCADPQLVILPDVSNQLLRVLAQHLDAHNYHAGSSRAMRISAVSIKSATDIYHKLWVKVMLPVIETLQ